MGFRKDGEVKAKKKTAEGEEIPMTVDDLTEDDIDTEEKEQE